ncbi:MAG TPA: SGNH/GDSL hydrolase family protein [Prolixibacteraceae bacterium]|nr:SGNH/GDSL hydrolase family protein [Prolixibacteraceae bacterium]
MRESLASEGDLTRLFQAFNKAQKGGKMVIGAIGGSITRASTKMPIEKRYANLVLNWWQKNFPKTQFELVNAGIGATGSDYGAMRVQHDLLSAKPDFVIVEFATNDLDTPEYAESYEGLIRQILNEPQKPAVALLFMTRKDGSNVQDAEIKIGEHYHLPMISYRNAIWREMQAGKLRWEQICADEVHPNEYGHAIAGNLVNQFLNHALKENNNNQHLLIPAITESLYSDRFEFTKLFDGESLVPSQNSGWIYDGSGKDSKGWKSSTPGSTIEFEISGTNLYLSFWKVNGPMGKARITIDGQHPVVFDSWFDQTWGGYRNMEPIARNLNQGKHLVKIELLPEKNEKSTGNEFRVLCIGSTGITPQ